MKRPEVRSFYLIRRVIVVEIRATSRLEASQVAVQHFGRFPVANLVEAPPAGRTVITLHEWMGMQS